ncbi:sigma-70 family RNA polymerase sigma factor [Halobacillus shinanisalinarum]|uniref:RNA polymerase sigma factor n=1 Tax=Halobacillus shinanisalinarum TaxID=2932258 RepID=A0ABY4GUY7_9BACI|nr:sigma-70 family RNA polymerase sigma factor [Halobacillus shinanisalinarum]UOQ91713.1 sigma-70 family RNA polymerase sigma factor [Halobacillus shinanisalinarum]
MISKEQTEDIPQLPNDKQTEPTINELVEEWIHVYGHDLKWLAYSYVKDHSLAEDLTQEAFIKAYQKYSTFKQQSSVKTWLYKITINLCKDHLKSSYIKRVIKKSTEVFRSIPSPHATPEEYLVNKSEDEELLEQILKLDNKYREMIILYYFEEFDVKDIAHVLKVSPNTVKTRLRRARQLLQEQLTSEGGSQDE